MKKFTIGFTCIIFVMFNSCKDSTEKTTISTEKTNSESEGSIDSESNAEIENKSGFDISTIPISNADLGDFPFFNLPQGVKEQNKPIERNFDKLFFAIDGIMTPIEGRVYKTNLTKESSNSGSWSLAYVEKSYDEAIKAVGGIKIFDGQITNDEYKRYHNQASYLGEDGSIGYNGQTIKTYVIRRSNGDDVYVQISGTTASGYLNIMQKEAFKQTITMMTSGQIHKDLKEKGKVVLHINFDTDKATLKADGKDAVAEISKALESDKNLKISINGYTDNSGKDDHNLQLSKDRAETVKKAVVSAGVEANRLTSDGFGSKNPIADNSTDEGKAQNRRVELIKN